MKTSRKTLLIAAALSSILLNTLPVAAEEEKPTANLTVGAYSQYIWRGWAYSKDSIVIQPSFTVGYKGFAANVWGNLDTNQYNATDDTNDLTEVDYTLSYDSSVDKFKYGAGYIYYGLEPVGGTTAEDTQEIYLKGGLDVLLAPTLTVYRDIDHYPGWYITFGISHSIELPSKMSLDLAASAGYYNVDGAQSLSDPKDATKSYAAFHNGLLSASLNIPVGKYVKVTPNLSWSFPLSGEASDRIELDSSTPGLATYINESEDNFVYGGIGVSFSF